MQQATLHDIKDALFDGMSQLVDTGLLLDHRFSVTSCPFRAGPNDDSVLPYKPDGKPTLALAVEIAAQCQRCRLEESDRDDQP